MSTEYDMIKASIFSFFAFLFGIFGWQVKRSQDAIREFPEKYVLKIDYRLDVQELKEEIRGLRSDTKDFLSRIHSRIDALTKHNENE